MFAHYFIQALIKKRLYFSAEHVEGRIDAFLDEFADTLRSLSDEDFKSQVNNVFEMSYLSIHNCKCPAKRFQWGSSEKDYTIGHFVIQ